MERTTPYRRLSLFRMRYRFSEIRRKIFAYSIRGYVSAIH